MEARAINRYIGSSPRKMRLVIDLIRGKGVEEALGILHFSPKHAARTAERVLRSAISNYQNKDEAGRVDTSRLFVKTAFVDGGPVAKRISPAPQGRAFRIRKRSNHVTIVVAQREEKKAVVKPSAAKAAPASSEKETAPASASAAKAKKKAAAPKKASKKS
jgi:large subunit ribosomal protein L22